ncbi:MAG: sugar ABC transporter ATP-binding protein [Vallitaleaceae bacterium]|nr:sugar ABC transporter ATP-binding protein [Vallitaleaceae bacterium]
MNKTILELKSISKNFGGVKALRQVNFQLEQGEIHALMGENGAGKSTTIKIITGVHQPCEGEIWVDGKNVIIESPKVGAQLGIAAIYQHVTSFPHLSVTENIFMGREIISKYNFYDWKKMNQEAQKLLDDIGGNIDAKTMMGDLSVAQQQLVEIAKALSSKARILIMDEPTASLTKVECEDLYRIAEKLRDEGVSIILISHKFEDVYRLASRVTVYRDAQYIGSWKLSEISRPSLIQAMVGRELNQMYPKKTAKIQEEVFRAVNLSKLGYFKEVSFEARKGEIVALTGLVGAGRTEVCQSIIGAMKFDRGQIYINGKKVKVKDPNQAFSVGIGYLPEDRHLHGLILDMDIVKNITLVNLSKFSKFGWLNTKKEETEAASVAGRMELKAGSLYDNPSSLSGGNQQKVVFSKLLMNDLKVIILDEPTKGVDVGAKFAIYEVMNQLAEQGYAVIMVSSEMPEVLGMADRVVVLRGGKVSKQFDNINLTQEQILEAALPDYCEV